MSRTGPLWMTALISAPLAFVAGCSPVVELGAMDTCGDPGVICDLDGGISHAKLPIGDAQYPDLNHDGLVHIAENMEGVWHGVVAGAETIFPPFEMYFVPRGRLGSGEFLVHCVDSKVCVPIGHLEENTAAGEYQLVYVDADRSGEGEFTWLDGNRQSAKFQNLLLQMSDQVLFFVVDIPAFGSLQFIMQRGHWPDAGVASESDASVPDPAAPRSSVDPGTWAP